MININIDSDLIIDYEKYKNNDKHNMINIEKDGMLLGSFTPAAFKLFLQKLNDANNFLLENSKKK